MGPVRLQQLEHSVVVATRLRRQRIGDHVGDVVVPDRHHVGLAHGGPQHEGGGPRPDALDRTQPGCGRLGLHGDDLLEPIGTACGLDDDHGSGAFHAEGVQVGIADLCHDLRRGRHPGVDWSGGTGPEALHNAAVRALCFDRGDPLPEDGRQQRIEDQTRPAQTQTRVPPVQRADEARPRRERRRVVVDTQQGRDVFDGPLRSRSPRLRIHPVCGPLEACCGGPVGCVRYPPHRTSGPRRPADGRTEDRAQRSAEVVRAVDCHRALRHETSTVVPADDVPKRRPSGAIVGSA